MGVNCARAASAARRKRAAMQRRSRSIQPPRRRPYEIAFLKRIFKRCHLLLQSKRGRGGGRGRGRGRGRGGAAQAAAGARRAADDEDASSLFGQVRLSRRQLRVCCEYSILTRHFLNILHPLQGGDRRVDRGVRKRSVAGFSAPFAVFRTFDRLPHNCKPYDGRAARNQGG